MEATAVMMKKEIIRANHTLVSYNFSSIIGGGSSKVILNYNNRIRDLQYMGSNSSLSSNEKEANLNDNHFSH